MPLVKDDNADTEKWKKKIMIMFLKKNNDNYIISCVWQTD